LYLADDHTRTALQPPSDRSGEAGYSLIELLTTISILAVILGAVLALADVTQRIAPRDSARAEAIRETQVGLHAMTRQLRQAYELHVNDANNIEVSYLQNGTLRQVRYECDQPHPTETAYNQCVRYDVVGGNAPGGTVVIDRVMNGPAGSGAGVFTYELNPGGNVTYATASVEVPAKSDRRQGHEHMVAFYDGFYMRNLDG
jgi:prepilin-type N-terminal cleavage/methylation domain-containing protein